MAQKVLIVEDDISVVLYDQYLLGHKNPSVS